MDANPLANSDWDKLTSLLPPEWRSLAEEHGLCRPQPSRNGDRAKLRDPGLLLRLVLHHVATETALAQTTAQADAVDLVTVSPVALHKRMRTVAPWLAELAARMDDSATKFAAERWAGFRVFATDATAGTRPGATGTTVRVHYRIEMATLRPQQIFVTDVHGGEMLRRFSIAKDDLDLADRGYCNPQDVDHVRGHDGQLIVRFNRGTLPLFTTRGRPLDIVPKVQRLHRPGRVRSWTAVVHANGRAHVGRICAVRLTAEATKNAQDWLRREHGSAVTAEDLEWAHFMVVFTTVPASRLTAEQVLDLFRLRWQVELQVKRDKSIGGLGHIPNFRDDTIASWICAKLLAQALARKLATPAPFPPCAEDSSETLSRAA